jgi:hypothetical protein
MYAQPGNDLEYHVSPAEKRLGWALIYTLNGWFTVPVPPREKGPILKGWPELRITEGQLGEYFQGDGNVGVLLGDTSGGLTDVDLDAKEALAATDTFLPQTPMISGRQGKPRSHRWYIPSPTPTGMKFKDPLIEDPKKATLVELRSNAKKKDGALQTIVPPSVHKETGEPIQWEALTLDPARIPAQQLIHAVTCVALTALVARYWPNQGEHGHHVVLALSGALLSAGLELDVVKKIVLTSARIAGYRHAKESDIEDTARNLADGGPVTGWPKLAEILPEKIVDQLWEWLGKPSRGESPEVAPNGSTALQKAVREVVLETGTPAFDKRRAIRDLVRTELLLPRRGFLCQTADGRGFYFDKLDRRLYDLEQRQFQYLLSSASGLSGTETQFRFVLDSFQTEAARTKAVEIHTLSFYESRTGILHVSDGGGGVWRRERGGAWEAGYNGDGGILFLTDSDATPWEPEFTDGALTWLLKQFSLDPQSGLNCEEQKTFLVVWLLQNVFPALRRTRIIPAFLGPQGSGKTSAERMIGTLFCEAEFEVTGLSRDREDGFVAAVSNRVIVALDNADSRIPWLEDALATYATGHRYRLRRLYTTNEEVSYSPRAILLLSSRDPHFRRPDVAERLLPFHFRRPESYLPESVLFSELTKRRAQIMGELLTRAGRIADSLSGIELPALQFRMADFASFGAAIARAGGKQREDEWLALLRRLEKMQMNFASEGDSMIEILRSILESEGVIGPIDTGSLYKKCAALAESESLPFARSASGFRKHLTNMKRVIEIELEAKVTEDRQSWRRYITIQRRAG